MIVDRLVRSDAYTALSPRIAQAFDFLRRTDLESLPIGRTEIDGETLYVLIQEYTPKAREEGRWEAHRRYCDLQYLVRGTEAFGVATLGRLTPGTYEPERDFLPLSGTGDILSLAAGDFILLLPEEPHMPGLMAGVPGPVRKAVVKIAVE